MRPLVQALTRELAEWLPRQRWFGGKDHPISDLTISAATELRSGDPALHHLIVDVHQDGAVDHYQVLVGVRRHLPDRLAHAEIGHLEGDPPGTGHRGEGEAPAGHAYDAAHDSELTGVLLANIAGDATAGPVRFRHTPGTAVRTNLTSLPVITAQSNTSLLFGEDYICKLFRRLSRGVNLDLEVNLALTRAGCPHVPAVHGWMELDPARGPWAKDDEEPVTLALLSDYLRTGSDGWSLAIASVRDWYAHAVPPGGNEWAELDPSGAGGDFGAEAERLGAATASVHRALAEAFGVTQLPAAQVRAMGLRMNGELAETCRAVPGLAPHAKALGDAFTELASWAEPIPVQRVHGDHHLGQVLRTETGWVLLDFEGEPARTPGERRALAHPLRDVAGMLRSFEYAARFLIAKAGSLPPGSMRTLEIRAHAWAARNRAAFCRGYAAAGGPDPAAHSALLRAFEFEKAVYEVRYEARNRPAWLAVPLKSLAHLTA